MYKQGISEMIPTIINTTLINSSESVLATVEINIPITVKRIEIVNHHSQLY